MNYKEISGFYGSQKTPCDVFVCETGNGNWYVAQGGVTINKTIRDLDDGVNVEEIPDYTCFTVKSAVETMEQFMHAIEA